MYPSEVRAQILADQKRLRERLELLDQHLRNDNLSALRAACAGLRDHLQRHIQLDDTLLKPELADTDAWSAFRVERLEAHHDRQQKDLDAIRSFCLSETASDEEVRALARRVLDHLRADFREQERLMLSEEVLRDDLVNVSRVS